MVPEQFGRGVGTAKARAMRETARKDRKEIPMDVAVVVEEAGG
jgi:hypothetical protein